MFHLMLYAFLALAALVALYGYFIKPIAAYLISKMCKRLNKKVGKEKKLLFKTLNELISKTAGKRMIKVRTTHLNELFFSSSAYLNPSGA